MDFTYVFDEEEDFTGVDFTDVFDEEEESEEAFSNAYQLIKNMDTSEDVDPLLDIIRKNPSILLLTIPSDDEDDEDDEEGLTLLALILEYNNLKEDDLCRLVGSILDINKKYINQESRKRNCPKNFKIQNWASPDCMTPLEYSIRYGYQDLALLLIHNGAYKLGSNEDSDVLNSIPDKISSSKNCFKPALASLKRKLEDPDTIVPSYIELLESLIDRLCSYKSCLFFGILQEIGVYYPLDTDSLIDFYQLV
jgi:hypothetical protein